MYKRNKRKRKNINITSSKDKIFNLTIGILGVTLCSVLAMGFTKDNKTSALNKEEYSQWLLEKNEGTAINSFNHKELTVYEKLKNGEKINVLILGDKLGISEGVDNENDKWHTKLENWITDTYESPVNLINLSSGETSIHKGLTDYFKSEEKDFDLVIVCYGKKDEDIENNQFPYAYEALIREIKEKDETVEIIPVIENSLREESEKIKDIKVLSEHYKLPLADVRTAFLSSGVFYYELVNEEGILPNEKGYDVYFNVIKDEIKKNVDNNSAVDEKAVLLHGGTRKFID